MSSETENSDDKLLLSDDSDEGSDNKSELLSSDNSDNKLLLSDDSDDESGSDNSDDESAESSQPVPANYAGKRMKLPVSLCFGCFSLLFLTLSLRNFDVILLFDQICERGRDVVHWTVSNI